MHLRERERKPAPRTLDLHWLEPPRPNGTLTVRGPLDAVGRDEHAVAVEAWARDVWAAWEPHHETVRGWLDQVSAARRLTHAGALNGGPARMGGPGVYAKGSS